MWARWFRHVCWIPVAGETVDGEFEGAGKVRAGKFIKVQIAGRGNVPADAVGVELNITAIQNEGRGFATLYPCTGDATDGVDVELHARCEHCERHHRCTQQQRRGVRLHVDHLPLRARRRRVHSGGFGCGDGGAGTLVGYSSDGETVDGEFEAAGKVRAGEFIKVQIAGRGNVPADAVGVELNITAIQNEGRGFATLYPCTATPPTASTLNYMPGVNIANATTVALNSSGEVCVYTSTTSHYALDVVAFIPAGSDVGTVVPARLLDTRPVGETVDGEFEAAGKVRAGSSSRCRSLVAGMCPRMRWVWS